MKAEYNTHLTRPINIQIGTNIFGLTLNQAKTLLESLEKSIIECETDWKNRGKSDKYIGSH